jgi:hypothetical protein
MLKSSRNRFIVVVSALVILVAIPVGILAFGEDHQPNHANEGGIVPEVPSGAPFLGAKEVTLDEARAALGFPIVLPETSTANDSDLSIVWLSEATNQLGLVYGDGDITLTMWPSDFSDNGHERFKSYLDSGIAKSEINDVDGHEVLTVYPGTDVNRSNSSYVEVYLNGVAISAYSEKEDPATLLSVASSLIHASTSEA